MIDSWCGGCIFTPFHTLPLFFNPNFFSLYELPQSPFTVALHYSAPLRSTPLPPPISGWASEGLWQPLWISSCLRHCWFESLDTRQCFLQSSSTGVPGLPEQPSDWPRTHTSGCSNTLELRQPDPVDNSWSL